MAIAKAWCPVARHQGVGMVLAWHAAHDTLWLHGWPGGSDVGSASPARLSLCLVTDGVPGAQPAVKHIFLGTHIIGPRAQDAAHISDQWLSTHVSLTIVASWKCIRHAHVQPALVFITRLQPALVSVLLI